MNDELRSEIEEMISEAIAGLRGELEDIAKKVAAEVAEDVAQDEAESAAEDALDNAIEDAVADAIEDYLETHERRLPDGTVVEPKKETMILSPDKKKLIRCRGRVEVYRWGHQGEEGQLLIYTGASNTDNIYFPTYDEAVAAFNKVKDGIESGAKTVEL